MSILRNFTIKTACAKTIILFASFEKFNENTFFFTMVLIFRNFLVLSSDVLVFHRKHLFVRNERNSTCLTMIDFVV